MGREEEEEEEDGREGTCRPKLMCAKGAAEPTVNVCNAAAAQDQNKKENQPSNTCRQCIHKTALEL